METKKYTGIKLLNAFFFLSGFISLLVVMNSNVFSLSGSFFGVTLQPPFSGIIVIIELVFFLLAIQLLWTKKGFKFVLAITIYFSAKWFASGLSVLIISDSKYSFIAIAIATLVPIVIGGLLALGARYLVRNKDYFVS